MKKYTSQFKGRNIIYILFLAALIALISACIIYSFKIKSSTPGNLVHQTRNTTIPPISNHRWCDEKITKGVGKESINVAFDRDDFINSVKSREATIYKLTEFTYSGNTPMDFLDETIKEKLKHTINTGSDIFNEETIAKINIQSTMPGSLIVTNPQFNQYDMQAKESSISFQIEPSYGNSLEIKHIIEGKKIFYLCNESRDDVVGRVNIEKNVISFYTIYWFKDIKPYDQVTLSDFDTVIKTISGGNLLPLWKEQGTSRYELGERYIPGEEGDKITFNTISSEYLVFEDKLIPFYLVCGSIEYNHPIPGYSNDPPTLDICAAVPAIDNSQ